MLLVWLLAAARDCRRAAARPHESYLAVAARFGSADHSAAMGEIRLVEPLRLTARRPGYRRQGRSSVRSPRRRGTSTSGRSKRPSCCTRKQAALAAVDQPRRGGDPLPRVGRTARLVAHRGRQAAAARTSDRGENQPSGLRRGAGGGLPRARVPGDGLLLRRRGAAPCPSGRRGAPDAGLCGRDPRPGARPRAPGSESGRRREQAERALRDALAIEPGLQEARLRLGQLLVDRGRLARRSRPRPGRSSSSRRSPALPGAALPRPPRRRPRPRRRRGRFLPPCPRGLARQPGRATGPRPGSRAVHRALHRRGRSSPAGAQLPAGSTGRGNRGGPICSARPAKAQASLKQLWNEALGR